METSTTIIGLLILALFILPIILISRSVKGKSKQYEKEFFSEASKNELTISEKSIWNENAFGMDTVNNKFIFINWSGTERQCILFELKDIKLFEPIPNNTGKRDKSTNYKKVERLGLKFVFKDSSKPDVIITFYTAGLGQQSDEEVEMLEKWTALIKKKMESKVLGNFKNSA